jgi:hypothetical protein
MSGHAVVCHDDTWCEESKLARQIGIQLGGHAPCNELLLIVHDASFHTLLSVVHLLVQCSMQY